MNEIGRWQDAITALPDKQFFNTIRLYLGEIKTPYNKQRLVEQLASFIRNEDNTNSIITLLDEFDIKVLTAISLIPKVTNTVLVDFFSGNYNYSELYAEIANLKERLIIFSEKEEYTNKEYLFINPLLIDKLSAYFDSNLILPETSVMFYSMDDSFTLTPNFLAGFISYLKIHGVSCKSDGIIKKNDQTRLSQIFPGKDNCIQLLMNAFINLSLVRENKKAYFADNNRLTVFADLPFYHQLALLCAASVSRFSREGLKKESQLLLDSLKSIPQTGYSRQTILRLAFLVGTYSEDGSAFAKKTRFSQMLEAARGSTQIDPQQNANLLDRMIDAAIEFGLLQKIGKDENGTEIFKSAEIIENSDQTFTKVLNIDSTFTVSIMPGLSLKKLLPLISFLMIKKCEVVTEFEITKQAVSASFDEGWTPENIFNEIETFSNYKVPENLKINISEWYNSYSSAILYHGYVLKVTESNINFAENNPNIKKYIKEKLAPGIYLLDIPETEEISQFIDESGLDFLGKIKTPSPASEYSGFPLLRDGHSLKLHTENDDSSAQEKISITNADKLLKELRNCLETSDFNKNQKESLEYRIKNRLILSQKQLSTTVVRTEILEADGMDFTGKVHLIDAAIKEEDMMELELPNANGDGSFFTLIGKPLFVSKQTGEAIMRFQVEPSHEIETILVSRITHLRRLRF